MKDMSVAKQILGIKIIRDRVAVILKLSQEEYVKRVLSRFNMQDGKPASTTLASHFKLIKELLHKIEKERAHMERVPHASAIGSLMFALGFVALALLIIE